MFHFKGNPGTYQAEENPWNEREEEKIKANKKIQNTLSHSLACPCGDSWSSEGGNKGGGSSLHLQTQGGCAAQGQSDPALPARGSLLLVSRIQIACVAGNDNDLDSSGGAR